MRNRTDIGFVSILVSTIMLGGCAHSVHDYSLPPLDRQTQIPMIRLLPGDQLQQHQLVYVEIADNQKIPPDGTIELSREKIDTRRAGVPKWFQYTLAPIAPMIIVPVVIVALPFVVAHELLKAPDVKGNASTVAPNQEKSLSQERHAQWLASVVMEGQWSSALDDTYISALNQALGWEAPPLKSSGNQYKQLRLGTGISRVMLLDSKLGERTLILCARSSVEQAGVSVRHFETCQSGNMGPAMPYDSPASSEALRAALLEQTSKLAALQAKALTGQTEFVQGKW